MNRIGLDYEYYFEILPFMVRILRAYHLFPCASFLHAERVDKRSVIV